MDGTGPVSGTESKGISLLPLSRSSSSALCTFKVSLTPGPRTRPGGSQNKDSLTPHRGLLTLQGHFPQGGRQPGPCMQDADLLLLFPFSACSPLCTHPSAAAAADAVHLRAEFLSSATGPDAHPPRLTLPCPPEASVGSGREKRDERRERASAPHTPRSPAEAPRFTRSTRRWLPGFAGSTGASCGHSGPGHAASDRSAI